MKCSNSKRKNKLIVILLLIILVFPTVNVIFGAINENYQGAKTFVSSGLDVSGNESSNIITKAIFWLINTCGSLGEYLITAFAKVLASTAESEAGVEVYGVMPWADAIIYNGVPALDVNFINPSQNSFTNILANVISRMYFTIFSISITFFGLAVLIMAIRLATTAIAAEKARYKESITNFIISLILIFSLHYFMSFCFYLNESLVKVAFSIAEVQLQGSFEKMIGSAIEKQKAMVNTISDKGNSEFPSAWFTGEDLTRYYDKLRDYISTILFDNGNTQKASQLLSGGYGDFLYDEKGNGAHESTSLGRSIVLTCMAILVEDNQQAVFENFGSYGGDWKKNDELYLKLKDVYDLYFLDRAIENTGEYEGKIKRKFNDIYEDCFNIRNDGTYSEKERRIMTAINDAVSNMQSTSAAGSSTNMADLGNSVISQLAVYFKINRYTAEGDISLVGVIVYTIFVFQSIMYFFSYLKRFFYIVILSFFAPFLVLFDFISKAIGRQTQTLSKWLKEFCALVFVQTIQAFLLTMVAALIVNVNETVGEGTLSANAAQGLAVINIIALASMAKLEQLITDMLDMKSSITDASLAGGAKMGMHGLVGGMMTLAAARRIGDNGKKVVGGIRNIASANKDYKNALNAKNKKMRQFQELTGANNAGNPNVAGSNVVNPVVQGNGAGGSAGGQSGQGGQGAQNVPAFQSRLSIKDKHKYEDALDACDAKIAEAKRNRLKAKVGLAGGILETSGAIAGGVTGAAFAGTAHAAAGTFDLSDVMSDAIKGAGVGDVIAESATNIVSGTLDFAKDVKAGGFGKSKIIKDIEIRQKSIEKAFKNANIDISNAE